MLFYLTWVRFGLMYAGMTEDLPGQLSLPIPEQPNPRVLRGVVGLISPEELAASLGNTEQTLAGWRSNGTGPKYVKLGKGVFYRLVDIHSWIEASVTSVVIGGEGKPV